jgi:hypothetical protein
MSRPVDYGPLLGAGVQLVVDSATATGDLAGLLSLLAPDATWTADSGGKTTADGRLRLLR